MCHGGVISHTYVTLIKMYRYDKNPDKGSTYIRKHALTRRRNKHLCYHEKGAHENEGFNCNISTFNAVGVSKRK